jgi:hypothetical protein
LQVTLHETDIIIVLNLIPKYRRSIISPKTSRMEGSMHRCVGKKTV